MRQAKVAPALRPARHSLLVRGYIVEVQVHMEQIMMRKKEGHEHYGYFRECCREGDLPPLTLRHIGFAKLAGGARSRWVCWC